MTKNKKLAIVAASIFILVNLSPYLLLRENGRYMDWDNLDSVHVWYKTLIESGHLFSPNSAVVESMMGGLPRSSFPSELNFTTLLFALMGPLGSYLLERGIAAVFAFVGMYLFVKDYLLPKKDSFYINLSISTLFSTLPFWPYGGLSVAGVPLLVYSFLKIRDGQARWHHWLYIVFNPFASSLVLSGLFAIVIGFFYSLATSFRRRNLNKPLFAGLFLFIASSVVANYRLFIAFFIDDSYVSHRVEFASPSLNSLVDAGKTGLGLFLRGQAHAHSLQFPFMVATVLLGLVISLQKRVARAHLIGGLIFVALVAALYGLKGSEIFWPVHSAITEKLPIQYDRFYSLLPVVWYSLFAISLYLISTQIRIGRLMSSAAIGAQALLLLTMNQPLRAEAACVLRGTCSVPTYDQFFSKSLFAQVKQYIGKPVNKYKVLSLGIHPSISLYNGMHTLDGYSADYPLAYKHSFRKVISTELEKNTERKAYFDLWGSRAYVFTEQDFGQMSTKWSSSSDRVVRNLQLNTAEMSRLGGQYLISAIPIDLPSSPGLRLLKEFKDPQSAWDIWLYQVK